MSGTRTVQHQAGFWVLGDDVPVAFPLALSFLLTVTPWWTQSPAVGVIRPAFPPQGDGDAQVSRSVLADVQKTGCRGTSVGAFPWRSPRPCRCAASSPDSTSVLTKRVCRGGSAGGGPASLCHPHLASGGGSAAGRALVGRDSRAVADCTCRLRSRCPASQGRLLAAGRHARAFARAWSAGLAPSTGCWWQGPSSLPSSQTCPLCTHATSCVLPGPQGPRGQGPALQGDRAGPQQKYGHIASPSDSQADPGRDSGVLSPESCRTVGSPARRAPPRVKVAQATMSPGHLLQAPQLMRPPATLSPHRDSRPSRSVGSSGLTHSRVFPAERGG